MPFGMRRSVKLGPFRFTASGSGISTSFGGRRARLTRGSTGRRTFTGHLGGFQFRKSKKG